MGLLLKEGFDASKDNNTVNINHTDTSYFFGIFTADSVVGFQKKYADDILAPLGLTYGTGLVGQATNRKLNSLCNNHQLPPPAPQSSFTLTSPNGGETLNQNMYSTFTWTSSNIASNTAVRIVLISATGTEYNLLDTSNSGSERVLIPGWLAAGQYKARVQTPINNPSYSDTSDNYFTVSAPTTQPSVTITSVSPNPMASALSSTTQTLTINGSGFQCFTNTPGFACVPNDTRPGYVYGTSYGLLVADSNGNELPGVSVTWVSSTKVTAQIPGISTPGNYMVYLSQNGQVVSNKVQLVVQSQTTQPSITSISPNSIPTAPPSTTSKLTINGSNFVCIGGPCAPGYGTSYSLNIHDPNNIVAEQQVAVYGQSPNQLTTDDIAGISIPGTYSVALVQNGKFVSNKVTLTVTAPNLHSYLYITSPAGNTSWGIGSTHNITWVPTNLGDSSIKISIAPYSLLSTNKPVLLATVPSSQGSYAWTIDSSIHSGYYKISISYPSGFGDNYTATSQFFYIASVTTSLDDLAKQLASVIDAVNNLLQNK